MPSPESPANRITTESRDSRAGDVAVEAIVKELARCRSPSQLVAMADLPRLSNAQWPSGAYRRAELPERVLQFGTGMLLRAVCAAAVDAANAAGAFGGRLVVVQSTPNGQAAALNAQDRLFTLVERGLERGAPVERARLVGSISRPV